jgi:hypothetical protein
MRNLNDLIYNIYILSTFKDTNHMRLSTTIRNKNSRVRDSREEEDNSIKKRTFKLLIS